MGILKMEDPINSPEISRLYPFNLSENPSKIYDLGVAPFMETFIVCGSYVILRDFFRDVNGQSMEVNR